MMRRSLVAAGLILLPVAAGVAFAHLGVFHPAADEPHWAITSDVLDYVRERGIATRASEVVVPPSGALDDPTLILAGAGNYAAMCATCHLAPGMLEGEIQRGMYPSPPNLTNADDRHAAETFWVIKHGIKMSGMPAWGRSMADEPLWGLTAFVLQLPLMTQEAYEAMVEASGGHDHGDGSESTQVAGSPGGDRHAGTDEPGTMDHSSMSGMKPSTVGEPEQLHGGASGSSDMAGMNHTAVSTGGDGPEKPSVAQPPTQAGTQVGAMPGMDHASMSGMQPVVAPRVISGTAEAVLQAFQDALLVGNVELALERLAAEVIVREGGTVERSRDGYARGGLKSDMALMKNADVALLTRSVQEGEQQTIVVSEARITTTGAGAPVDVITTETATLRKSEDGWRIVELARDSRPFAEERAH